MGQTIKKSVNDLVAILKKQHAPGQKKKSIWNVLQDKLSDEGTWDQNLIKAIEKETSKYLDKYDKKTLTAMWEDSDVGLDSGKEPAMMNTKEIKQDLVNELVDRVMDKLDSGYSKNSYFDEEDSSYYKEKADDEDEPDEVKEPDSFDEDINFEDDIFDDDDFLDDDDKY